MPKQMSAEEVFDLARRVSQTDPIHVDELIVAGEDVLFTVGEMMRSFRFEDLPRIMGVPAMETGNRPSSIEALFFVLVAAQKILIQMGLENAVTDHDDVAVESLTNELATISALYLRSNTFEHMILEGMAFGYWLAAKQEVR